MERVELRSFVSGNERRPVHLGRFALSDTRDCDLALRRLSHGECQTRSADTFERGETFELHWIERPASRVEVCRVRAGAPSVCWDVQPDQSGI